MGWGRYFLLGDLGQQLDLSDQQVELENMRYELARIRNASTTTSLDTSELKREIAALQRENDELRMYLTALIRLLVSKGAIGTDELTAIVNALDSEDGMPDSRYKGDVV